MFQHVRREALGDSGEKLIRFFLPQFLLDQNKEVHTCIDKPLDLVVEAPDCAPIFLGVPELHGGDPDFDNLSTQLGCDRLLFLLELFPLPIQPLQALLDRVAKQSSWDVDLADAELGALLQKIGQHRKNDGQRTTVWV